MNARVEFFKNQIGKDKWQFPYPLMDWMTAEALEAEEGLVKMRFTVKEYMLNPIKMLDELMGAAGFLMNRPVGYATINMNVDFLHSAKLNEILIGEGKVVRAGKTVMHTEAKITNADGKVVAKATSNLIATQVVINM